MEYKGWGVYAWHGVRVPDDIITAPQGITPQRIDAEQNAEVRRVMLERFGTARYLLETNAQVVDKGARGTLYRRELAGDEPLVMVQVLDATPVDGERRQYMLRVPPTMTKADEAVAWTFGKSAGEYASLRVET